MTRVVFHVAHTLAVQEEEPEVLFDHLACSLLTPPTLQLSPLICGWGSSLQSLDLSGCHFRSSTFVDQASRMMVMERLVLREARGDALMEVVGGAIVSGCCMLSVPVIIYICSG